MKQFPLLFLFLLRPLQVKNTFHIGQWSLAGKWLKNRSWQECKLALKVQHSALQKARVIFSELLWAIWWNSIDSIGHFGVSWICFAAFQFLWTNCTFLTPQAGLLLWPQTLCCGEQNAGVLSWGDLLTALSKDLVVGDLIQKADRCWSSFAFGKILLAATQLKILFSGNAWELDIWLLWGMLSHSQMPHLDSAGNGLGCCSVPQTQSGQYLPGFKGFCSLQTHTEGIDTGSCKNHELPGPDSTVGLAGSSVYIPKGFYNMKLIVSDVSAPLFCRARNESLANNFFWIICCMNSTPFPADRRHEYCAIPSIYSVLPELMEICCSQLALLGWKVRYKNSIASSWLLQWHSSFSAGEGQPVWVATLSPVWAVPQVKGTRIAAAAAVCCLPLGQDEAQARSSASIWEERILTDRHGPDALPPSSASTLC